jgi:glycerol-3-phosphate acyltransferase PlsY
MSINYFKSFSIRDIRKISEKISGKNNEFRTHGKLNKSTYPKYKE